MTGQDERINVEAFSVLTHEIRLGVLQAFFDHWRESESPFRAVIDVETETSHASIVVDADLDVQSVMVDSPD